MAYRLAERYTDAELEEWVEQARRPPSWALWWVNGMVVGLVIGWVIAAVMP